MSTTTADSPLMVSASRRLTQREFLLALASLKCRVPLIALGIALLALTICGVLIDIRLLIVVFMLLTIVLPALMCFLYFAYAMSPRCIPCIHEHHAELFPGELRIVYTILLPPNEEADDDAPVKREVTLRVPLADISSCRAGLNEFTLTMRRPFGLLKIRYADLPDAVKFEEILKTT